MPDTRTDAEVVCGWMEEVPTYGPEGSQTHPSVGGWWHTDWDGERYLWRPIFAVCPNIEKLGRLHLVEERLSEEQIGKYDALLREAIRKDPNEPWVEARIFLWHVDAPTRLKALATVLRAEGKGERR